MSTADTMLIMAAGTGGHVFPGLAVARCLQARGLQVEWLASERGMENDLLKDSSIPLHRIPVKGLAGKGWRRLAAAPWMLLRALLASLRLLRQLRPVCVLGMGGYISGPGGIAARLLGIPLVLHEQNAVPGITNRLLRRHATLVLETFPGTFAGDGRKKESPYHHSPLEGESARQGQSPQPSRWGVRNLRHTGIPLRQEICRLHKEAHREYSADSRLHLLVLGGSLGSRALNEAVPATLGRWPGGAPFDVWHQTGGGDHQATVARYTTAGLDDRQRFRVVLFIEDMAAAYRWAHLVLCRAGAATVGELAAAKLPAVLVPYPHHRDQQQLHNARWLVAAGAARLLEQESLLRGGPPTGSTAGCALVSPTPPQGGSDTGPPLGDNALYHCLNELSADRALLQDMARRAGELTTLDADVRIADCCEEVARG